jgi:hypothetical protein
MSRAETRRVVTYVVEDKVPVPEVVRHWPEPVVATAAATATVAPVLMMMGDVKVPGHAAKLKTGVPPPPTNVTPVAVPVLPIDIVIAGEPDGADDDRDSEPDVATVKNVILPVRPLRVIDTDEVVPLVNWPTDKAPVAELNRSGLVAVLLTVPMIRLPLEDDDSDRTPALPAATAPASMVPDDDDRDRVAPEVTVAPLHVIVLLHVQCNKQTPQNKHSKQPTYTAQHTDRQHNTQIRAHTPNHQHNIQSEVKS